ncbi:hypothetical protein [uncultured Litoreibacter sp.]|uniref:hypothetical protein n=1 Tax=uncultured Litoreibacter sp. TaxID=1392394 RepID=UPI002629C3A2|nr:hypothetical protein [uncultured Litoreibacter sp.]
MHKRFKTWLFNGTPFYARLMFIIGAATLTMKAMLESRYGDSVVVYLAIPFVISILLHQFTAPRSDDTVAGHVLRHVRSAMIVMLASSALLMEGFICVLFMIPIYLLGALLAYVFMEIRQNARTRNSQMKAYAIPALVALLSIEGLTAATSLPRFQTVSVTRELPATAAELQANMAKPITFNNDRTWLLSVFPLPVQVNAGSLNAGDTHSLDFIYKRWFFTLAKRGQMHLHLDEVRPDYIHTTVTKNTSYLAGYMDIDGTEVHFHEQDNGTTRVTLTLRYESHLDPSWYFGPLQSLAMRQSADYLINNVIAR